MRDSLRGVVRRIERDPDYSTIGLVHAMAGVLRTGTLEDLDTLLVGARSRDLGNLQPVTSYWYDSLLGPTGSTARPEMLDRCRVFRNEVAARLDALVRRFGPSVGLGAT